jgi:hypothetical protein
MTATRAPNVYGHGATAIQIIRSRLYLLLSLPGRVSALHQIRQLLSVYWLTRRSRPPPNLWLFVITEPPKLPERCPQRACTLSLEGFAAANYLPRLIGDVVRGLRAE